MRPTELRLEFDRISAALVPLREQARRRFATTSPEFNIFRILRLERKEVITHSPVLANLFDPYGTHAQGGLFLQTFFDHIAIAHGLTGYPKVSRDDNWLVDTEKVTELGNLDIIVSSSRRSTRFVIENKIGAADQLDQLPRYWTWMQGRPARLQHLFYLTPTGRECSAAEAKMIPYTRLSYLGDIVAILAMSLPHVSAIRVRETLQQYLEIIPNS